MKSFFDIFSGSRGTLALTPTLSPEEREKHRALLENVVVMVTIPAVLIFVATGDQTVRVRIAKNRTWIPLSCGRGLG
jgi:hypothetical protein